jgi:hypothetical protein
MPDDIPTPLHELSGTQHVGVFGFGTTTREIEAQTLENDTPDAWACGVSIGYHIIPKHDRAPA